MADIVSLIPQLGYLVAWEIWFGIFVRASWFEKQFSRYSRDFPNRNANDSATTGNNFALKSLQSTRILLRRIMDKQSYLLGPPTNFNWSTEKFQHNDDDDALLP